MNSDYCIVKEADSNYKAIIVSLSQNSLTDFFDEIASNLEKNNITGKVLLDYYNYNNSQKRRFFEVNFETKFPINSLKRVNADQLQNFINNSYKNIPALKDLLLKKNSTENIT